MTSVRFIHAADLHLDSPFIGLQHLPSSIWRRIQESTFSAFEKVVDAAIKRHVDFVLLCGDLYDGEDRSIKAQARMRKQLERLEEMGIYVYLLHGNHDHLGGLWTTIDMPGNVQTFSAQVEKKRYTKEDGTTVHLYGFSYPNRHVLDRKVNQYVKTGNAHFHIGLLHGHCEGGSKVHQPYAPFSLADLLEKGMDYWALGHIHQRKILHEDPVVLYPGNIQGRHRKETGEKGCYFVSLSKETSELDFIETADIVWESLSLSAAGIEHFSELFALCKKKIEHFRRIEQGLMLELILTNVDKLSFNAREKIENGELIEVLQDGEEMEAAFVWIYSIHVSDIRSGADEIQQQAFTEELAESVSELRESSIFLGAIQDLAGHTYGSRYLEPLTEEEKMKIVEEAAALMLDKLHRR
ncbi:metallophosphoesterase family protein [Bacillus chungangensis]|uniref:DNA repair exonuclease SbcCD nuclease subunit n=1 Tax=Bacillus chungangensis TaxID=587633 RepID=A0ABT9WNS3_9BACI|nr:DNA repair exonuclease [Bacillus chungangensis]MDQ0174798.1 DNA repair exonuclease SbcCD nuclease subunit [Bacillus chungangensis]